VGIDLKAPEKNNKTWELVIDHKETLNVPKWKEVGLEEIKALEKNKNWSVMTLPEKTILRIANQISMWSTFRCFIEKVQGLLGGKGILSTYV
jgi:hypothetical protein